MTAYDPHRGRQAAGDRRLFEASGQSHRLTLDPANKELVVKLIASKLRLSNSADVEVKYNSVIDSFERAPYSPARDETAAKDIAMD